MLVRKRDVSKIHAYFIAGSVGSEIMSENSEIKKFEITKEKVKVIFEDDTFFSNNYPFWLVKEKCNWSIYSTDDFYKIFQEI